MTTPAEPASEIRLRAELIRRNYTANDVLHLILQGAPAGAAKVLEAVYLEMTATIPARETNAIEYIHTYFVPRRQTMTINFNRRYNSHSYVLTSASADRLHSALYHAVDRGEYKLEPGNTGGYFAWPQVVRRNLAAALWRRTTRRRTSTVVPAGANRNSATS